MTNVVTLRDHLKGKRIMENETAVYVEDIKDRPQRKIIPITITNRWSLYLT